jgi:Fe2+ transport system protein FeoA
MSRNVKPTTAVAAAPPVPLTSVPAGALLTLADVRDVQAKPLLRSLGLSGACQLRLCKAGDPYIVQVRETRIGLSRTVAQQLFVMVDPGASR